MSRHLTEQVCCSPESWLVNFLASLCKLRAYLYAGFARSGDDLFFGCSGARRPVPGARLHRNYLSCISLGLDKSSRCEMCLTACLRQLPLPASATSQVTTEVFVTIGKQIAYILHYWQTTYVRRECAGHLRSIYLFTYFDLFLSEWCTSTVTEASGNMAGTPDWESFNLLFVRNI